TTGHGGAPREDADVGRAGRTRSGRIGVRGVRGGRVRAARLGLVPAARGPRCPRPTAGLPSGTVSIDRRGLGVIDRLTRSATEMVGRRLERRTFLKRMAVAGSALAVAPVDFMIRPLTAQAIIRCRDCARGLCCDGWTAFCCTINKGINACPANSY